MKIFPVGNTLILKRQEHIINKGWLCCMDILDTNQQMQGHALCTCMQVLNVTDVFLLAPSSALAALVVGKSKHGFPNLWLLKPTNLRHFNFLQLHNNSINENHNNKVYITYVTS